MKGITITLAVALVAVILLFSTVQTMNIADVDAAKDSRLKACTNPRNTQEKDPKFCTLGISLPGALFVRKVCVVSGAGTPCTGNPPFSIQISGLFPQPSTFTLRPGSSQLVTLGPGTFTIVESAPFSIFSTTFSGDCRQTGSTREATVTISAGEQLTCTITNRIIQD